MMELVRLGVLRFAFPKLAYISAEVVRVDRLRACPNFRCRLAAIQSASSF